LFDITLNQHGDIATFYNCH